jgi:hypothetical protein
VFPLSAGFAEIAAGKIIHKRVGKKAFIFKKT